MVLGGVAQGPDDDDADHGDADDGDCHWFLCVCLRVCARAPVRFINVYSLV